VLDRVTKDLGRHPQMSPRFEAFNQLLEDDPFGEGITHMGNFQKSKEPKQRVNADRPLSERWVHYHAHLKGGHPTFVVGWWVNQKTKEVIIEFFGTHEKANSDM